MLLIPLSYVVAQLMIDHTMTAPEADISRTSTSMPGRIVDRDGNRIDPCDGG